MSVSEFIGVLGGIVGLIGGATTILTAIYQRKQTRLMQEQIDQLRSLDTSYAEWTAKWEQAADALRKIYSGFVVTGPSTTTNAYGLVSVIPCAYELSIT